MADEISWLISVPRELVRDRPPRQAGIYTIAWRDYAFIFSGGNTFNPH